MHFRRLRMEPLEDRRLLATFSVINLLDGPVTAAGQLPGSLRQAIFDANATVAKDEIVFGTTTGTINLSAGELVISKPLDILGSGQNSLTIDAHDNSRIFSVEVAAGAVLIRDLKLKNGNVASGPGGAVRFLSTGTLSIEECQIISSRTVASASHGGGIYSAGALLLKDAIIEDNSVEGSNSDGGGIYAAGSIEIVNSIVRDNFARGSGGGIRAQGIVTVTNSAIIGNNTNGPGADGGGIYGFQDIVVEGSTISGNYTTGQNADGGGIFAIRDLDISHSTITDNETQGSQAIGGGVAVLSTAGTRTLAVTHSILQGNSSVPLGDDMGFLGAGTVAVATSYSVLGTNSVLTAAQSAAINGGTGNLLNVNPLLGALQNNGGPTLTHALLPGSPAINKGNTSAASGAGGVPSSDQRGAGFARVSGGRIDMGAFEVQNLTADYDSDGDVDGRDFLRWQRNPSIGNLVDWRNQYGSAGLIATIEADSSASLVDDAVVSTWFLTDSPSDSATDEGIVLEEPELIAVVDNAFENWSSPVRPNVRDFGDIAVRRAGVRSVIPAQAGI
jgi:predicted outer membrane repeat protein